jgi:hypothetical protein
LEHHFAKILINRLDQFAIDIAECKIDVPNWGLAMADR